MMTAVDGMHGGLNGLADTLKVPRHTILLRSINHTHSSAICLTKLSIMS